MASADLHMELLCSVCREISLDPATLPCGHSFCQGCITQAWDHQHNGESTCPECMRRYKRRPELQRNQKLYSIAKALLGSGQETAGILCTYCDFSVPAISSCLQCETSMCDHHLRKHNKLVQHTLIPPVRSVVARKCSVHMKILDCYCTKDSAAICASCRLDGEHQGHQVKTLDEVSEKKKQKLRKDMENLISKIKDAEERVQGLQEHIKKLQEKAEGETERVTTLFRDLRRQLDDLERRLLRDISRQVEQEELSYNNLIWQLVMKKDELSRKMRHIEDLCKMDDPLSILLYQDLDGWDSSDTMKEEDRDNTDIHNAAETNLSQMFLRAALSDIMKCANLLFYTQGPTDVTLDLNTAANNVNISHKLQCVRWSPRDQNKPETSERFGKYQVISARSFSSGQHYWDVETSQSGSWGIGVCYPSTDRMGDKFIIGENSKSWSLRSLCLGRWYNQYSARHEGNIIQIPHRITSAKLRIYLDYEAGQISFYELCDPIRHLHTFTATFTEPLHAAFYVWGDWWYKDSWVRITPTVSQIG